MKDETPRGGSILETSMPYMVDPLLPQKVRLDPPKLHQMSVILP